MRRLMAAAFIALWLALVPSAARAQSADWQKVIWREPQVRYLLADLTLGGDGALYRKYATEERDPDSREAIRLWDSGVRVVNRDGFERKQIPNPLAKDGKAMRVVLRGSNRTITGSEVLLDSDRHYQQAPMRVVLADLTLGTPFSAYEPRAAEPAVREAIRRWKDGARATNASWFEVDRSNEPKQVVYRGTHQSIDGANVRLNSDVPYCEVNVRYFLADIYLGGGRAFYDRAAESAHETACREAITRFDAGVTISNLADLERKTVDGKTLITRKASDQRISGVEVKLSTD